MKTILPPSIVGEDLQGITEAELLEMGFKKCDDGSGAPWGIDYEMKTTHFRLTLDPTMVAHLYRVNPDTDEICLYIEGKSGLQRVIDWIQD